MTNKASLKFQFRKRRKQRLANMDRKYAALPHGLLPRGLTREAAAAYCGLSLGAFDMARKKGAYSNPTLPGGRYDLVLLQAEMNKASGLNTEARHEKPVSYAEWVKRKSNNG